MENEEPLLIACDGQSEDSVLESGDAVGGEYIGFFESHVTSKVQPGSGQQQPISGYNMAQGSY